MNGCGIVKSVAPSTSEDWKRCNSVRLTCPFWRKPVDRALPVLQLSPAPRRCLCLCSRDPETNNDTMAHGKSVVLSSMCRSCRSSYITQSRRTLSTTPRKLAADDNVPNRLAQRFNVLFNDERPKSQTSVEDTYSDLLNPTLPNSTMRNTLRDSLKREESDPSSADGAASQSQYLDEPYHLNVYSHKHNTHITFTEPSRNPILSLSCGSLGLRNAQKASYDASFQLAAYTFRKMAEKQWKLGGANAKTPWCTLSSIRKPTFSGSAGAGIEVIFRGFGPGREAFQKALLGTEGRLIKPLISKVTDGTRLKFGGTRSPQVRRLG